MDALPKHSQMHVIKNDALLSRACGAQQAGAALRRRTACRRGMLRVGSMAVPGMASRLRSCMKPRTGGGSSGESSAHAIAGASGCVIGKEAADRLGLQRFGGMAVSGMAGRLESCFRRADSLQLGPVTISNCLFM